jgi:glycerol-3-phosphate acyltransferase PlsY
MGAGIVGALYCIFMLPGWGSTPVGIFTIISAMLLVFTHRSNIKRLLNGNEHRFNVLGRFR